MIRFDVAALALVISVSQVLLAPALAMEPLAARDRITASDLRTHVSFLASDSLQGRKAGTDGGHAAAAYIADQFRSYGLPPETAGYRQEFGDLGMRNVIARWANEGDRQAPIIVSAHYDHVGRSGKGILKKNKGQIHNGADDNASGTALVLELAEACSHLPPPKRPVLFALWDGEEQGLVGSGYDAKRRAEAGELPALVIVCDMIGRASCDRVYLYGSDTVANLEALVVSKIGALPPTNPLTPTFIHKHLPRSDHWPFFKRDVPYLFFHTGLHDSYHRPADDADTVNYEAAESISRLAFELLMDFAANEVNLALVPESKDLPRTNLPPRSTCDIETEKSEKPTGNGLSGESDIDVNLSGDPATDPSAAK